MSLHLVRLDEPAFLEILTVLSRESRFGSISTKEKAMNGRSNLGEAAPLEGEKKVRSTKGRVWAPTLGRNDERPGVVRQEHNA